MAMRDGVGGLRRAAARLGPAVAIMAYIRLTFTTQRQLAAKLGVSQASVSRLLDGTLLPNSELRAKLEDVCSIPRDLWDRF